LHWEFFAGMTLTLHKPEAGCETYDGLFYRWSLLCNNNMATNLQRFSLSDCRRCLAACDCWL